MLSLDLLYAVLVPHASFRDVDRELLDAGLTVVLRNFAKGGIGYGAVKVDADDGVEMAQIEHRGGEEQHAVHDQRLELVLRRKGSRRCSVHVMPGCKVGSPPTQRAKWVIAS